MTGSQVYNTEDYIPMHRDSGCNLAKENGYKGPCLDCPFPECLEEMKTTEFKRKQAAAVKRNKDIRQLHAGGMSVKALAARYKKTEFQIREVLKRGD